MALQLTEVCPDSDLNLPFTVANKAQLKLPLPFKTPKCFCVCVRKVCVCVIQRIKRAYAKHFFGTRTVSQETCINLE